MQHISSKLKVPTMGKNAIAWHMRICKLQVIYRRLTARAVSALLLCLVSVPALSREAGMKLETPIFYSTQQAFSRPQWTQIYGAFELRPSRSSHLQVRGRSPLLGYVHIAFNRGVERGDLDTLKTLLELLSGFPSFQVQFSYERTTLDMFSGQRFVDAADVLLVLSRGGTGITLQDAYSTLRWWLQEQRNGYRTGIAASGYSGLFERQAHATTQSLYSNLAAAWSQFSRLFSDRQKAQLKQAVQPTNMAYKPGSATCASVMGS